MLGHGTLQESQLEMLVDDDAENDESRPQVTKISLKPEYMKIQRKKVAGSQQRIEDGHVYFTVVFLGQIANVRVYVQRYTDWMDEIIWEKPENGWSELYVRMLNQKMGSYDYMADLDSVYKGQEGSQVYGLFKNKGNSIKNYYVFFVMVELLDQNVEGFCWPFLLKTKPAIKHRSAGKL